MIDGISNLYHLKHTNEDAALDKACKEFESIFAYQIIKAMGTSKEDGLFEQSDASKTYDEMFFWEVACKVSEGEGLGLAKIVREEVKKLMAQDANHQGGDHVSDK